MGWVDAFAVEDRAVQIAWAWLPKTDMVLEVGGRRLPIGAPAPAWYRRPWWRQQGPADGAGPGAVVVDGLDPSTTYDVSVSGAGFPRTQVASVRTLAPPPGRLLSRFATISDCHLGERWVGPLRRLHDPQPPPAGLVPYPARCAGAAIGEARAWGAELLVAKGDLTCEGEVEEIHQVGDLLRSASMPVEAILGNHDVRGPVDTAAVLAACGLSVTQRPRGRDMPGFRLVLGHSPLPDRHLGALPEADIAELARLAGEAGTPVVVALHHPPRRRRVQTHYPPSIARDDSTRLVTSLAAANPATVIIAGHTHRNRRYQVGGLTVAEVGATKDYPGQWAGYSVYEGGLRQVVYRIAEPAAIGWTEKTRDAMFGIWGWWSPGRLDDRCWTLEWPDRARRPG